MSFKRVCWMFACGVLALLALVGVSSSYAFASGISELREQASAAKEEYDSLFSEAELANDRFLEASAAVEEAESREADARERVRSLEGELIAARDDMGLSVASMYKSFGRVSVLSLVSDMGSMSDVLHGVDMISRVRSSYSEKVDGYLALIEEADESAEELAEAVEESRRVMDEAKAAKEDADALAAEAEEYYESLSEELRAEVRRQEEAAIRANYAQAYQAKSAMAADADAALEYSLSLVDEDWRKTVIEAAYSNLGGTYVWGGESYKALDCSGLVRWCYQKVGVTLNHWSGAQAAYCDKPASEAVPGDILWKPGHVGLYVGRGVTIEALGFGNGIGFGTLSSFYKSGSPF